MTPQQKEELIRACDSGDDVKAVTLCLHIAAWNARKGLRETAVQCRALVDELQNADANRAEYMRTRLKIAMAVSGKIIGQASREEAAAEAIRYADALMAAMSSIKIGG